MLVSRISFNAVVRLIPDAIPYNAAMVMLLVVSAEARLNNPIKDHLAVPA